MNATIVHAPVQIYDTNPEQPIDFFCENRDQWSFTKEDSRLFGIDFICIIVKHLPGLIKKLPKMCKIIVWVRSYNADYVADCSLPSVGDVTITSVPIENEKYL